MIILLEVPHVRPVMGLVTMDVLRAAYIHRLVVVALPATAPVQQVVQKTAPIHRQVVVAALALAHVQVVAQAAQQVALHVIRVRSLAILHVLHFAIKSVIVHAAAIVTMPAIVLVMVYAMVIAPAVAKGLVILPVARVCLLVPPSATEPAAHYVIPIAVGHAMEHVITIVQEVQANH